MELTRRELSTLRLVAKRPQGVTWRGRTILRLYDAGLVDLGLCGSPYLTRLGGSILRAGGLPSDAPTAPGASDSETTLAAPGL